MAWTTTTLLAQIRRVASLPTSASVAGYTDADLLAHADAALQGRVAPLVANARDEHAIHTVDVAVAAAQSTVRLPPRVASGRLRDVTMLNPNGAYVSVPRFEPEDVARGAFQTPATPQSVAVVVQAGFLRIVPVSTTAMTLRLSYVRAPPQLAAVSACTLVTALTAGTPNITATHTGTIAAGNYDFVLAGNGDSLADVAPTVTPGVGSTTFAAASMSPLFQNIQTECSRYVTEGLYLCPSAGFLGGEYASTTCIVPLPNNLSALLAQWAAVAVLQAIGDDEAAGRITRMATEMEAQLVPLLSERIEGEPQVVRPTFQNRGGRWRGW